MLLPDPSAGGDPTAYKMERGQARSQPQHQGSLLRSPSWQVTRQFSAPGCTSPLHPFLLGATGQEEDDTVLTQRPHRCQAWPHHPKSCNLFLLAQQDWLCAPQAGPALFIEGKEPPGTWPRILANLQLGPFLHISSA